MITADELVEMTEQEQQSPFKLGTVVELFDIGTAKIQFDGEEEPSEKEYSYLASYKPSIGDRVLLASVAGTYVIMDRIMYKEVIEEEEEGPPFESLTVTGKTKTGSLEVTGSTSVFGNLSVNNDITSKNINVSGTSSVSTLETSKIAHKSNGTIGFYGATPISRKTVWTLLSSAELSTVISKVNELLRALKAYGLIHTD